MVQQIFARHALLKEGWRRNVAIDIGADGRIARVEADADLPAGSDGVVLPAMANLHSHSFQRAMAGLTERRGREAQDSFWTWRSLMYRFLEQLGPDDIEAIAALVQMEMLEAGYACVAEFHYLHHQPGGAAYGNPAEMSARIAAAAETSGIGLTLLPVLYTRGGCDGRPLQGGQLRFGNAPAEFEQLLAGAGDALKALPADANLGMAAHSLRAVSPDQLNQAAEWLPDRPFHIHVAEQTAEVDEVMAAYGQRPVEWLMDAAQVDGRWCLVHCTQMTDQEARALAASGAVAGLCPVTEANLGDGIFNGTVFTGSGGRFGIGSDSNVNITLAGELSLLEYAQRLRDRGRALLATADMSCGRFMYEGACAGGARAAGRDCGAIAECRLADLVMLDGSHPDLEARDGDTLVDTFVFAAGDRLVREVWSAGRHVVRAGQHTKRAEIVARYRGVMRGLEERL